MTELTAGVLDRFKVSCWWCSKVEHFHPTHDQTHKARFHARALGWFFSTKGWQCPSCCRRTKTTAADRAQITLPGFGVLSRNAR